MRKKIINSVLACSVLALLSSCQSYFFDEKKELKGDLWAYNNPLGFEFKIEDTSTVYNLLLDIKHKEDYPNANVYTMLHVTFPDGKEKKQQVSLELAENTGKWSGECSGDYCTRRLVFMPNTVFDQAGAYKIKFEQFSRKDSLEGINSLRLIVEKTKDKKQ